MPGRELIEYFLAKNMGGGSFEPTNFDDITPLIANFLDSTTFNIQSGGLNSVRRCIIAG